MFRSFQAAMREGPYADVATPWISSGRIASVSSRSGGTVTGSVLRGVTGGGHGTDTAGFGLAPVIAPAPIATPTTIRIAPPIRQPDGARTTPISAMAGPSCRSRTTGKPADSHTP